MAKTNFRQSVKLKVTWDFYLANALSEAQLKFRLVTKLNSSLEKLPLNVKFQFYYTDWRVGESILQGLTIIYYAIFFCIVFQMLEHCTSLYCTVVCQSTILHSLGLFIIQIWVKVCNVYFSEMSSRLKMGSPPGFLCHTNQW